MKAANLVTLLIVGGINWLLVGAFRFDLVATLFRQDAAMARIVYILVGISAIYQLVPFFRAMSSDEVVAQRR